MHPRDFRLLFFFREVARAGSIRAGAEALGVSSPAASQAIRELEDLLGVTLMRRTTRSLILTDTGQQVLAEAEAMVTHAGAAMNVAASDRPVTGTLRISAPGELTEGWLPPILAHFHKAFPDVVLSIEAQDAADPRRYTGGCDGPGDPDFAGAGTPRAAGADPRGRAWP